MVLMSEVDFNNPNLTYIPATANVAADLHVAGDLLVEGHISGRVEAAGFCIVSGVVNGPIKALGVKVMPRAEARGDIEAQQQFISFADSTVVGNISGHNVEINNRLQGSIAADGQVVLGRLATVEGDISSADIVINKPAVIKGNVSRRYYLPRVMTYNNSGD